jgi:hypothetical protein
MQGGQAREYIGMNDPVCAVLRMRRELQTMERECEARIAGQGANPDSSAQSCYAAFVLRREG